MRYSLEPKYRKYVQGYGFLIFAKKIGHKYGKKLMDTTTINTTKTPSKRVVQKTAESTGDLMGNKIPNKITSLGKSKSKENDRKKNETNEVEEIYIPSEKRKKIIDDLKDCFRHHIKMEYQNIKTLLGNTHDKVPKFITKKWIENHNQSGETYNTHKQIRFKTSMLRSDLCDYSDVYIVVKQAITIMAYRCLWSNDLVVKALDSQSRGPVFKTSGWPKV